MANCLSVYGPRRKRLLSLAKGRSVVVASTANLFYVTGFFGSGVGMVTPEKTVVVTGTLEAERVAALGTDVEVVVVKRWAEVPAKVSKLVKGRALVDDDASFRSERRFSRSPETFLEARRVKDRLELERIRKASRVQDKAFAAIESSLKPGKTEWEVAAEVMKVALENGATQSSSDSALSPVIIAGGPNGALPHSELSGRKVRRGDFVVADIFLRYEGYHSDQTRTFAVGTPTSDMKRAYAAVLESQLESQAKAVEGAECGAVSDAAFAALKRHRLDRYLIHSVGHGVGIDIHEAPSVTKGSRVRLLRDDVVTIEPGVYFAGRYGIRIEDTLRVDAKPEQLTKYTKELVTVG
jgi:Xaa-Pro aminopeptidase